MPNNTYHAFTTINDSIVASLKNKVFLNYNEKTIQAEALWDTGATVSCISKHVVEALSLIPTGCTDIQTPAGKKEVNTYLINIGLPNNVSISDLIVLDSDIGDQGIDVLIGMNIITLGDFTVSNYNNKTVFSFRLPSKQTTDYVKQIQVDNKIGPKHGKGKRKKKR